MSLPDLTADAVPVPALSRLHEGGSAQHPVERSPGGAGQSVDPRVSQAREARRRADEMLRAAQEATRKARLAREKADALYERAALLEAGFLARLEQRRVTGDLRPLRREAAEMRARNVALEVTVHAQRATVTDVAELRRRLASAERRAANLEIALASNRRIGQAIGILVAAHRLTEDQAFEVLRQCSSRRNVKLAVVAEDVVHTGELPSTGRAIGARPPTAGRPRRVTVAGRI